MKITIISTFADDYLIDKTDIKKHVGGPAFFITKFLEAEGLSFELITGERGVVEIEMIDNRELGKINFIKKFDEKISKKRELVLFSSLLREFSLNTIGKFNCVDIQGLVRDENYFGGKKYFDCEALKKFDLVKGTKQEMQYIPLNSLKKDCIVVKTNGSEGFEIFFNNKNYIYNVEKIDCVNTIGAGDTFFVAFCTKYYETKNIHLSANFAKEKVSDFLKKKMEEKT